MHAGHFQIEHLLGLIGLELATQKDKGLFGATDPLPQIGFVKAQAAGQVAEPGVAEVDVAGHREDRPGRQA